MKIRPRFSLRTLAIVVALICAYLACWGPTERAAEQSANVGLKFAAGVLVVSSPPLQRRVVIANSPLPLIVRTDELEIGPNGPGVTSPRRYYLWLFGPQFKLPFEGTWPMRVPVLLRTQG